MNGIIWLASYPKSGNTWLRIFVENLFRNTIEPAKINELTVVRYSDNSYPLYERVTGRDVRMMSDSEIHLLRDPVQSFLASQQETTFVKSHNGLMTFEGHPLIYLEHTAGAIYLLRNPFDMVVSFADHYKVNHDDAIEAISSPYHRINTTKQGIFQILGGWTNHYRSWFSVENFKPLLMRYEDMIRDPVKSFSRFNKFLGLPKNPERLKRAIRNSSFKEAKGQELKLGFNERSRADQQFFRVGKVGSYRKVLTERQIGQIIDAHGELLVEAGYINKTGRLRV